MARTKKDVEPADENVVEEVAVDDTMPQVEAKDPAVQEAEKAKQPDINDPEDGNKTYAEVNA